MRELPVLQIELGKPETYGNLAEELTPDERRTLATDLIELIGVDETSMSEWVGEAQGFLDNVTSNGGDEKPQDREQEGSAESPPPSTELTLSAVIQFSARATDALLGEPDLAKASEPGAEPQAQWVSSQLRTRDPNWILDTDPLVVHMSVTGLAWRKRSFDDIDKEFHTAFLTSTSDVIVNANARSVERMPRITHQFERYPYEIERSIQRKHWIDYEPRFEDNDPQAPKRFYETDAWLDLDGDGIDEPWIITISRDDMPEVIRISPRWSRKTVIDTDDKLYFNAIIRYYPYRFLPDPKGGFLPMGFGKLLHRVEATADNLLASITNTAQSEAKNGGVLGGSSVGMPDKVELQENRVNIIPTNEMPLDKVFSPFPVKQVSPGSVTVLEKMMTLGDRLAGTLNQLENAPASMTATMAKGVIDSGAQVQSAVHRRMVTQMTQEFRWFLKMADAYDMLPPGLSAQNGQGVAVTADPQLATEMHRSALSGFYMELLKVPQVFNAQVVGMALLQTARIPNADKFIAQPQPPQATPHEKMQGMIGLMKQKNERIKVVGAVAVQLTQALKNMVEASGGMLDNRMALLNMAQLEQSVQQLMSEAANASTDLDGMAAQSGDTGAQGLPSPEANPLNSPVFGGAAGGGNITGQGGGV